MYFLAQAPILILFIEINNLFIEINNYCILINAHSVHRLPFSTCVGCVCVCASYCVCVLFPSFSTSYTHTQPSCLSRERYVIHTRTQFLTCIFLLASRSVLKMFIIYVTLFLLLCIYFCLLSFSAPSHLACCHCSHIISSCQESRKEEFRKYLEKAGVLDALTKGGATCTH